MSARTLVVPVLVIIMASDTVLAHTQGTVNDPDALRAYAETLGQGTVVRVMLMNGSQVNGTLTQVTPSALWVRPKTRIEVQPLELPLANIKSVEPRKPAMNAGKKVLMFVGIGAAVFLAAAVATAMLIGEN